MTKVAAKSKLLDSVATISATETDVTVYDLRGMEDCVFEFLSTLNTGFSTGSALFKGQVLGCDTRLGTFVLVDQTAELVVDVVQRIPSVTNAPGVVLPRFIKIKWEETGAISSFTATARLLYNRTQGAGKQVDHGSKS